MCANKRDVFLSLTRIGAYERIFKPPARDPGVKGLEEHHQHGGEHGSKDSIEDKVEESDLGCWQKRGIFITHPTKYDQKKSLNLFVYLFS
jgi:hypothetical protein